MNDLRPSFIALCLILLTSAVAAAADRGFLLLGSPRQSVQLNYNLTNTSSGASSHDQRIMENYGFGIDYAVLNPDTLAGSLALNLVATQNMHSESRMQDRSTSNLGFLYDIKGDFYPRSTAPLSANFKSQYTTVQRTYGGSYNLTGNIVGLNWAIRNSLVPLSLNYSHSKSTTDGAGDDRTYTYDSYGVHAGHTQGISRSVLDMVYSKERYWYTSGSGGNDSNQLRGTFTNTLAWNTDGLERGVDTSIAFYDYGLGPRKSTSFDLQETLRWDLGKALKTRISARHSNMQDGSRKQDVNSVEALVEHRLFQSLITQLQGLARDYRDQGSKETEVNGRLTLTYRKNLPYDSILELGGYRSYGVTDRRQDWLTLQRTAFREPHTAVYGQRIVLANPNYVSGSIRIYNANPAIRPAALWYSEGTDFTVDTTRPMAEIIIIPNSPLDVDIGTTDGNRLLITYDYRLEGSTSFSTTGTGANGSVSLLGNLLRLFATLNRTDNEPRDGNREALQLNNQEQLITGFSVNLYNFVFSLQYEKNDSTYDVSRTLETSVSYSSVLWRGNYNVYLRNSYIWYPRVMIKNMPDSQNMTTIGGSYVIPSILAGSLHLRADYVKWLSNTDSDRLSVGADLRWSFRNMVISLNSNYSYSKTSRQTSNTESLSLQIMRTF
jgi:hypothetical protein